MVASATAKSGEPNCSVRFGSDRRKLVEPSQMDQAPGRRQPRVAVAAGQPPMVGREQVATFLDGNRLEEMRPLVRVDFAGAVLVEPADLLAAEQKNAPQHQFADGLRMALRIGQRQRAAPGTAEHQPPFDTQMLAQHLHVRDQVPGGVVRQ